MSLNWINRRNLLIAGGVILAIVVVLLIILLPKSCGSSSSLERDNTLKLVQRYIEKGEYDRAMDLLDGLLIKNADDPVALAMMDEIIALKAGAKGIKTQISGDNLMLLGCSQDKHCVLGRLLQSLEEGVECLL